MIIEKLSSLTVKVSLNKNELTKYGLCFENLADKDSRTRNLIERIITEIKSSLGINLYNEHLYIEALSGTHQDCIFYISAIETELSDETEKREKLILETSSEKDLIMFSSVFSKYFSEDYKSSSLYYRKKRFRIIIDASPDKYEDILDSASDCGLTDCHEKYDEACTKEYFICIFEQDAIPKLSGAKDF